MTVAVVLALGAVMVAAYAAAWRFASRPADDGERVFRAREQARRRRQRRSALPPLPSADAPPPGLLPLVPSPRTVRVEAERGIRELEDWLAGRASA